jgi:thiamine-monophosphate kinase
VGPDGAGSDAEEAVGREFRLIAKLRERLARSAPARRSPLAAKVALGSGDDAAITVPDGATATSVDLAVDGVHFRLETAGARSIGRKALAAALSDLAAMGAVAGEAFVQLGLPEGFAEGDCLELADGLAEVAAEHGVEVLGGDISRAPALTLAVSVVGHAESPEALVRRDGARAGDVVCVTGELGGARAGHLLLERPELGSNLAAPVASALRARQLEPEPRLAAGRALAAGGASAMIDISDGLAGDAEHVARASGVRLELEAERIPIMPGVAGLAATADVDPVELAASGGEDYELLASIPPAALEPAVEALAGGRLALTMIGRVVSGEGVAITRADGSELEVAGYDQLR